MAKANVPVSFNPVDTKKVEAALARIQSQAKGVNFGRGAESINKLSRPLGKITGQASEFQKSLEASNARVLAFGASVAVINKLSQAFGALVSNTVKVEASFAKINVILGGSQREIEKFGNGIFKVAQNTATSFDQVAEGALELARQGLGVAESLSRVETALKLVRVAGIDSKEAVAGLTAAIKGFEGSGLTVTAIADKLAEVDTKFAVSTEDLINGLERASASARVAGVSFDELLGVITTVQERTQRGGAVIGNAFKTIFARLGRTDTLKALQDLGISVLDAEGNVRAAVPLFQELAVELDKLGLQSVEAGKVIQKVAGVRQRDILISLVEDLNSGQSQFAKSLQVSAGAAGALDAKNAKLNDTLEALINNLTVGGQKLASVLGEIGFTDQAKDILKFFGDIVNSITDLLQGESMGSKFAKGLVKGIGATLTPGLALVGAIFIKLFIDLAKFGVTSLKQILGINKAAQQQTALQQSILQTLLQNEAIQREIIALEGNKVAQEQLLLKIYNQQAAALARVQKAAATVTPGLFGRGFRGGERGVTKRGAGGYVAAEARDVSRGVGGAPASSKVVSIPNFAFGGGQRGTMVANTSEYFVPNYKGGGDAIFSRDMVKTMGLPSGAKKLNASDGFIPNFSIASMRLSEVNRALTKSKKYANPTDPKLRSEKAQLLRRKRALSKKPIAINNPNEFVMIVPSVKGLNLVKRGQKGSANEGLAYTLVGFKGKKALRAGVSNDEALDAATEKFALNKSFSEAKLISGNKPKATKLEKLSNQGAISSLSGSIFETAVSSLLSSKAFDRNRDPNARFDFLGGQGLSKLFRLPKGAKFIEAKIRNSPDMQKSMFGKIKKQLGRASDGYIPNYAESPLEEAIMREKEAGVPINQIRVNQSGKLRNAKNPKGLAVTNTQDEPTGKIPNFKKGKGGSGFGGGTAVGGIFAAQALSGMIGSFLEADGALSKFNTALFDAVTIFSSLTLLGPAITGFGGKLDKFSKSAALTSARATPGARAKFTGFGPKGRAVKMASLVGVIGKFSGLLSGLLRFAGPIGIAISILIPLARTLGLFDNKAKQAAKALDEHKTAIQNMTSAELEALQAKQQSRLEEIQNRKDVIVANARASVAKRNPAQKQLNNNKEYQALLTEEGLLKDKLSVTSAAYNKTLAGRIESEKQLIGGSGGIAIDQVDAQNLLSQRMGTIQRASRRDFLFGNSSRRVTADGVEVLDAVDTMMPGGFGREALGKLRLDALASSEALTDEEALHIKNQQELLALEYKRTQEKESQIKAFAEQMIASKEVGIFEQKSLLKALEKIDADSTLADIQTALTEAKIKETTETDKQFRTEAEKAKQQALAHQLTLDEVEARHELTKQMEHFNKSLEGANARRGRDLKNLERDVPKRLADGLETSIGNAMDNLAKGTYDSLGDVFLNIALDFGKSLQKEINDAVAKSLVQSMTGPGTVLGNALGNIGSAFNNFAPKTTGAPTVVSTPAPAGNNSGGLVTGGNGVTDDIAARLTGGEFVLRKSAVQKYGVDFLDRLNNQAVNTMQGGGSLQGADNVRTERFFSDTAGYQAGGAKSRAFLEEAKRRDFFVPGQRGFGGIVGKENLLAFAQQQYTSGQTDVMNFGASGASINLEDQSRRLSAFGRRRDSPARRALREAQAQALDLYNQSAAEEQRVIQENRDAKTARRKAFQQAVVGAFVNAAIAGVSAGIQNRANTGSFFGPGSETNLQTAAAGMLPDGTVVDAGTSINTLGPINGQALTQEISTPKSFLGFNYTSRSIVPTDYGRSLLSQANTAATNFQSYQFQPPPIGNANGGLMAGGSNALLMDGEYVMGAEAASSLGTETLNSMNSLNYANGGAVGGSTISSGGSADVGAVNIEINIDKDGSATDSATGSGEEDPQKAREFSRKIKDVVLNVINEEKRVSGSLFTRNK